MSNYVFGFQSALRAAGVAPSIEKQAKLKRSVGDLAIMGTALGMGALQAPGAAVRSVVQGLAGLPFGKGRQWGMSPMYNAGKSSLAYPAGIDKTLRGDNSIIGRVLNTSNPKMDPELLAKRKAVNEGVLDLFGPKGLPTAANAAANIATTGGLAYGGKKLWDKRNDRREVANLKGLEGATPSIEKQASLNKGLQLAGDLAVTGTTLGLGALQAPGAAVRSVVQGLAGLPFGKGRQWGISPMYDAVGSSLAYPLSLDRTLRGDKSLLGRHLDEFYPKTDPELLAKRKAINEDIRILFSPEGLPIVANAAANIAATGGLAYGGKKLWDKRNDRREDAIEKEANLKEAFHPFGDAAGPLKTASHRISFEGDMWEDYKQRMALSLPGRDKITLEGGARDNIDWPSYWAADAPLVAGGLTAAGSNMLLGEYMPSKLPVIGNSAGGRRAAALTLSALAGLGTAKAVNPLANSYVADRYARDHPVRTFFGRGNSRLSNKDAIKAQSGIL